MSVTVKKLVSSPYHSQLLGKCMTAPLLIEHKPEETIKFANEQWIKRLLLLHRKPPVLVDKPKKQGVLVNITESNE